MPAVTNLRILRRKIKSVENLRKITRAMQMVSAAKLRKTQTKLMQVRPYADKIKSLLEDVASRDVRHEMFESREHVRNILFVVISGDKGLCGTYNSNILRETSRQVEGKGAELIVVGKKSLDFFSKRNMKIKLSLIGLPTEVPFSKIQQISSEVTRLFSSGEVDEVFVSYTKFVNALNFKPTTVKFIPIEKATASGGDYIFEPEPQKMLDVLIPRYLSTALYRYLLESLSSEHAARMNAMRNATDNAEEMIDSLTLLRNKVRQSSITKELLDIVTGTEALKAR